MAVRRTVAKGEAITTDVLAAEFVIHPGDQVRIVSESGKLQVTAKGEARSAGRIGDRIQVKNLQSGVMLQAVVVDEGLVAVRF
jgi:flagella basal body P-ring formation protein FlgA